MGLDDDGKPPFADLMQRRQRAAWRKAVMELIDVACGAGGPDYGRVTIPRARELLTDPRYAAGRRRVARLAGWPEQVVLGMIEGRRKDGWQLPLPPAP